MAIEKRAQQLLQRRWAECLMLQRMQRQVQTRHMNAAGIAVIQADPDIGVGMDALPSQVDRQRDALHANPVQRLCVGRYLRGYVRQSQCVHQKSAAW